jgi:hypothetical protein
LLSEYNEEKMVKYSKIANIIETTTFKLIISICKL